jgi:hypothetical protein
MATSHKLAALKVCLGWTCDDKGLRANQLRYRNRRADQVVLWSADFETGRHGS